MIHFSFGSFLICKSWTSLYGSFRYSNEEIVFPYNFIQTGGREGGFWSPFLAKSVEAMTPERSAF